MKTSFWYKGRYWPPMAERNPEALTGLEALRMAKREQEAWEEIVDMEDRDHPLWRTAQGINAAELIVISYTNVDTKWAAVHDLITESRYLVPLSYTPSAVLKNGPAWAKKYRKSRGVWNHEKREFEGRGDIESLTESGSYTPDRYPKRARNVPPTVK